MMIIEIVFGIIILIVVFFYAIYDGMGLGEKIGSIVFGTIMSFLGYLVVSSVVIGIIHLTTSDIAYRDVPLVAANMESGSDGGFLYVNPALGYHYFTQQSDGSFVARTLNNEDESVRIYEDDSAHPTLRIEYEVVDGGIWSAWGEEKYVTSYAFFVPEGSVIREYNFDLGE